MAKNSIIRHLAFCCVFHCEIVKCNLSLFAKVSENLQLPQKLWKLSIKLLEAAQAKKSRYKRRLQHNNETTPLLEASLLIIGGSRKGFEVRCFINLMNRQKRENPFWSCGSEKDNPLTTKEISWVDIAMPINFISWLNLFKPCILHTGPCFSALFKKPQVSKSQHKCHSNPNHCTMVCDSSAKIAVKSFGLELNQQHKQSKHMMTLHTFLKHMLWCHESSKFWGRRARWQHVCNETCGSCREISCCCLHY